MPNRRCVCCAFLSVSHGRRLEPKRPNQLTSLHFSSVKDQPEFMDTRTAGADAAAGNSCPSGVGRRSDQECGDTGGTLELKTSQ